MQIYETFDFLPDLEASRLGNAAPLPFSEFEDNKWDFGAFFYTNEDFALLRDTFSFTGKKGAEYDLISTSFFDPFLLRIHDNQGNVVAYDEGIGDYGSDFILDFIAPYDGTYFVSASWDQGLAAGHKDVTLLVLEDVDTIPDPIPEPPAAPTPIAILNEDKIFNWGEDQYPNLFPEHQESADIFGYYARIYSNGNALGELDDNIYFYDSAADTIVLVGLEVDFINQAVSAGF